MGRETSWPACSLGWSRSAHCSGCGSSGYSISGFPGGSSSSPSCSMTFGTIGTIGSRIAVAGSGRSTSTTIRASTTICRRLSGSRGPASSPACSSAGAAGPARLPPRTARLRLWLQPRLAVLDTHGGGRQDVAAHRACVHHTLPSSRPPRDQPALSGFELCRDG